MNKFFNGIFTDLCKASLVLMAAVSALSLPLAAKPLDAGQLVTRIGFGSCAKEREPQPIWSHIANHQPDVFLMLGDNQYADYWKWQGNGWVGAPVDDPARFKQAYDTLASIPEFAAFRKNTPILGTWDDHDYGKNDGGKEYGLKQASQQAFLDFFAFPQDDPIRQQQGIYHSKIVGPEGKRVQFIMLDTRYHRDPVVKKPSNAYPGRYVPTENAQAQLLGEAQWQWLEQQLKKQADIRVIASSIQVVAFEHGWESWGNFPHQRQRLYDLIGKTKASGVVFVSGDRHLTEISVDKGQAGDTVPYSMWDFTSSGLNQAREQVIEANRFRVGDVDRTTTYGTLDINWATPVANSMITFTAWGEHGKALNTVTLPLKNLTMVN